MKVLIINIWYGIMNTMGPKVHECGALITEVKRKTEQGLEVNAVVCLK